MSDPFHDPTAEPSAFNPYASPESDPYVELSGDTMQLAERSSRFFASLLDSLLVMGCGLVFLGVGVGIGAAARNAEVTGTGDGAPLVSALLMGLCAIGFIALIVVQLTLLHRHGQTLGKRWRNIRIVRTDGSRASLGRIFWLRIVVSSLPGMIPFLGYAYALADPLFIFRDDRRCIHDLIADTVVVCA